MAVKCVDKKTLERERGGGVYLKGKWYWIYDYKEYMLKKYNLEDKDSEGECFNWEETLYQTICWNE